MKKIEFLELLESGLPAEDTIGRLIERIKDTLRSFPDDIEIDEFTSLKTFVKEGGFTTTQLDSHKRDIYSELNMILTELQTWVDNQVSAGKVYSVEASLQSKKLSNHWKTRMFFMGLFAVVAIVAAIFTFLRFKSGEDSYRFLPEIIGLVDLILGVFFFILEQIDDKNSIKRYEAAKEAIDSNDEEAISKHVEQTKIIIKNSGNYKSWFSKVINNYKSKDREDD